jgi:putative heme-binding domain-containing protein
LVPVLFSARPGIRTGTNFGRHRFRPGKGGKVGPDLNTHRRDDLDTMLLNTINPSAEIREGFSTSIVAMADGRVLTGVVVEQDKNVVVLRLDDGKELTIARDDIDAIKASPRSLMPEGLLRGLGDQEIRDLFAYLRSTQSLID